MHETKFMRKKMRCATIGCRIPETTATLIWRPDIAGDPPVTERLCTSCAESYMNRPWVMHRATITWDRPPPAPSQGLVWENAGHGDAGDPDGYSDQNADSAIHPHSYWSLCKGLPRDRRWGVELIVRDDDLQEIPHLCEHLGHFDTEEAAKAAAQERENRDG